MRAAGWNWVERLTLTALLFLASVGVIFRSLYELVYSRVPIPASLFAIVFLGYCIVVVWLSESLMRTFRCRLWDGVTRAAMGFSVVMLVAWSVWAPLSLDLRADRDDALDLGVRSLLSGEDPWTGTTQLGNHISPLLGGLLLAVPFVLLSGASLQAPFVLAIAEYASVKHFGIRLAGSAFLLLFLSPVILNEVVFESDIWILALLVMLVAAGSYWFAKHLNARVVFGLSIAMAILVADRFILAAFAAPIAVVVFRGGGRRLLGIWTAGFLLVTLLLYGVMLAQYPAALGSIGSNVDKATGHTNEFSGALLALSMLLTGILGALASRRLSQVLWSMTASAALLPLWQFVTLFNGNPIMGVSDYRVVSYSAIVLIFGVTSVVVAKSGDEVWRKADARPRLGG